MKISFATNNGLLPPLSGDFITNDALADFFLWLAAHRTNERVISLISLLAEHEREQDPEEKANIRRTLDEILTNEGIEK